MLIPIFTVIYCCDFVKVNSFETPLVKFARQNNYSVPVWEKMNDFTFLFNSTTRFVG